MILQGQNANQENEFFSWAAKGV